MLVIIVLFYIIVKRELRAIWGRGFPAFSGNGYKNWESEFFHLPNFLFAKSKEPENPVPKWFLHSLPYSCYTITKHISYESKVHITIYFLITFQKSMLLYQSHIKAGGE